VPALSTGSAELDALIEELQPQDNVVFFTTAPDDYLPFVRTLVHFVARTGARLMHVRGDGFLDSLVAQHPSPMVLDLNEHRRDGGRWLMEQVEEIGSSAYYVFDPLASFISILGSEDRVRALFLTLCPRLFELRSVAYWDLSRTLFRPMTIAAIRDCTQLFLRVESESENEWILTPSKVWGRYSEAMFYPHRVTQAADGLHVVPAVADGMQPEAYTQTLAEKNRELAEVRDILNERNNELLQRNGELAELNARLAEQSRLYESLRLNLDHLRSLFQAGWDIGASLAVDQVQSAIMNACERLFRDCAYRLYLPDSYETPVDRREGDPPAGWEGLATRHEIIDARHEVAQGCAAASLRLGHCGDGEQLCSAALAPITVRGRCLGSLEVYAPDARLDDQEARMLLSFVASESSIALENAYLYRETDLQREQLRSFVDDVIQNEERESRQLALDLHDGLVQMIVASYQRLQTAQAWRGQDPSLEEREISKGIQILREAIHEARRLISQLRPAGLDDFGLEHALRVYLGELQSANRWDVRLDVDGAWPQLPPVVEASLFRIIQEGANNALRHAAADHLEVQLEQESSDLIITVSDAGRGFDPTSVTAQPEKGLHMGLVSIRERARLLGGSCQIQSAAGQGTRIVVTIPLASAMALGEETP
jgi:signal transduction histidine kinase